MLISGTQKKTFTSNRSIWIRMFVAEIVEGAGGWSTSVLLEIYDRVGVTPFKAAVKAIGMAFGASSEDIDELVSELGEGDSGWNQLADILRYPSSLGLEPSSGFLFVQQNDELGIPAGEYSKGAVWQAGNSYFEVEQKREWIGAADWAFGVPNLSWLGEWEESEGANFLLDVQLGRAPSFSQDSPSGSKKAPKSDFNALPFVLAALGGFAAPPVGIPIGFIVGQFLAPKKNTFTIKPEQKTEEEEQATFVGLGIGRP
jgi:hypothetical protein